MTANTSGPGTSRFSSGWQSISVAGISSEKLAIRTRDVLAMLTRFGVSVPDGNRLQLAASLADEINAHPERLRPDDPDLIRRLSHGFRAMFEAVFILNAAVSRKLRRSPFTPEALSALLDGALVPVGDEKLIDRDLQFELYVAGMLAYGGRDIWREEADLQMLFAHQESVGIVMRHVTSDDPGALRGHVRAAAQQLAGQQLRGFVALQLDPWLDGLTTEADMEALGAHFNEMVGEAHTLLPEQSEKRALLGAFILGNRIVWHFDGLKPTLAWHSPRQFLIFTDDAVDVDLSRRVIEPLQERLHNGLREIEDLVCSRTVSKLLSA